MDKTSFIPRPQKHGPNPVFLVVFILVVLLTLVSVFRSNLQSQSIEKTQSQLVDIEKKIQDLQKDHVKEYVFATKFIAKQAKNTLTWSDMMKKFQELTPVSVFYSSFSLAESGKWNVSGIADSYDSIADVVRAFEKSKDFNAEFVPSVTVGASADGQAIMSFSLRVEALTPKP